MLLNLDKKNWSSGLELQDFSQHQRDNEASVNAMLALADLYNKSIIEEGVMDAQQLETRHVGKQDPKRHLQEGAEKAMSDNIVMCMGKMLDVVSF